MARHELGLGKGKVYPADRAGLLLNPFRRLLTSPGRLARGLGLARTARVLELGCGPGFFSPHIAGRVPEGMLVLVAVLGEVGDAGACLRELRRVLRAGGRLAVSETRADPDYTRSTVLCGLAPTAGFRLLRAGGPPWEYTAHFTTDVAA